MHHSRRTHNAHNETQRRLNRVLLNGHTSSWRSTPHYSGEQYRLGYVCYVPDWQINRWTNSVGYQDVRNNERNRSFLVKNSRSSGSNSHYRFVKRMIHKKWRRKKYDDVTYSIKGSHCSWSDVMY